MNAPGGAEVTTANDAVAAYAASGKKISAFSDWGQDPLPHEEFAPRAFAALRIVAAIVEEQKTAKVPARREHVLAWIEDAIVDALEARK